VRYEQPYWEAADAITDDTRRLDELVLAAELKIAGDAESCPEFDNSPLRMARAQIGPGEPIARVLFTIQSDHLCSVWHVDLVADPTSDAEDASG
jgi:hypothetical protein